MQPQTFCPACGEPIPPDASAGLCPRCLLGLADSSLDLLASAGSDTLWPAAPEGADQPRVFGSYELLNELARGGMGVVYRARQRELDRVVALKMVQFGRFAGEEARSRFLAEARTAARLRHPRIVAIHEIGTLEGQPYFTMDLIEGDSLAEAVRNGPWSPRAAASLLHNLTSAVAYAHSEGVLHRDLKPSNILLDAIGQPHVTDFGLAKLLPLGTPEPSAEAISDLTLTGQALGSPNYMAPEQARGGRELTPATDLWALGAILYHILTGRPPFARTSVAETLQALQQTEPVLPRILNPDVPVDLETICLKCLEKEPARRYQTAQALADELDRFLKDEPIRARPVSRAERVWRWCRRKPALAGALGAAALFLIAGLAGVLLQWREARQHATRAEANELKARRAQYASDMNLAHQAVQDGDFFRARQLLERHGAGKETGDRSQQSGVGSRNPPNIVTRLLTPDSRLLTPDLRGWEWHYLWQQSKGEELFMLGTHSNGVWTVGVMPDANTAFSGGGDNSVRFWNLQSREPMGTLPHPRRVNFAIPTPDGAWMITGTEDLSGGGNRQPVRIWDLANRQVVSVLHTNSWFKKSVSISSDGQWLAFADTFDGILVWNLPSRTQVATLPTDIPYFGPLGVAFSPDNRTLAYNDSPRGDIVLWHVLERREIGRLAGHVRYVRALTFSPNGKLLASASQEGVIKVWDTESRRERWSIEGGLSWDAFRFSPDGTLLAAGTTSIQLYDAGSGQLRGKLQGHQGAVGSLAFTPDGRQLISGSMDGTVRVWGVASAFTDRTTVRLPPIIREGVPWDTHGPAVFLSPDGLRLLTVYQDGTFGLWDTLDRRELLRAPLPLADASVAAIQPGGGQIAFGSVSGKIQLWETASQSSLLFAQPETTRINKLTFSADGQRLAMGAGSSIRVFDVASRAPLHAFNVTNEFVISLEFSDDGTHLMAGFFSGLVKLWNLEGAVVERSFRGHESQVRALALADGGRTLISSGSQVKRWDVESGRELAGFLIEGGSHYECRLTPDGRRILFGSGSGVSVWDLETLQPVLKLKGPVEIPHLAFSPNGDHLIWADRAQLRVLFVNVVKPSTNVQTSP